MKPLEQLNLLLWLAWAPQGLFVKQGFQLEGIDPLLPVPPEVQRGIHQTGLKPKPAVSPDLLLRHLQTSLWRIIECKISSFGPDSLKPASQAAALLALPPQWLAKVWGEAPGASASAQVEVCYALNPGQEEAQQATLDELRQRLTAQRLTVNPAGAFGLYADGRLRLQGAPGAVCYQPPQEVDLPPEGVYPLLPVAPSIDAYDEGWKDLQERLRSVLVAWMAKHLTEAVDNTVMLRLEEDLLCRAILVWDVWRDKGRKHVRQRTKDFVRTLLEPVRQQFDEFYEDPPGQVWHLRVPDAETAEDILRKLTAAASRQRGVAAQGPEQLALFDATEE